MWFFIFNFIFIIYFKKIKKIVTCISDIVPRDRDSVMYQ